MFKPRLGETQKRTWRIPGAPKAQLPERLCAALRAGTASRPASPRALGTSWPEGVVSFLFLSVVIFPD